MDCQMVDMGFKGKNFTWDRGNFESINVRERLDRNVANSEWLNLFHDFSVTHLPHSFFDHCPLFIQTELNEYPARKKRFNFESWWILEPPCEDVIKKLWAEKSGDALEKLDYLRANLQRWGKTVKGERDKRSKALRKRLAELEGMHRDDDNLAEMINVKLELNWEMENEELYWEKRVITNWLRQGDQNTTFFHSKASQSHRTNKIRGLENMKGDLKTENTDMENIIRDYFMELFQSSGVGDTNHLLSGVERCIGADMNQLLIEEYKEEEVVETINSIGPTKASGPDGFPIIFFQKYWHIVGREVSNFCLEVLNTERIMHCISTVSYSVVLNGVPGMVFTPRRGLRQGDPLSPFLFLLCSEGLSTLLRLATEEGVLKGIKASRRVPQISHLLFADDCVLFGEAVDNGTATFEKVLKEYEICSGQLVKRSNNSEKYLGLPNMVGRKKRLAFQHLKDRLKLNIDSWSTRLLSQGGKEVFIKAILQAIPMYTMACFLLPKSLCEEMEQIIANFWWQKGYRKRGIHWCSWSKLCELKESGSLGFRNLAKFNLALLAKQGWRLIDDPNSLLARTLKAKYYPSTDFLNSGLGNLPSYTWKSIWAAKGLLLLGLCWRVGNGHDIRIEDVWVPNVPGLLINKKDRTQNITMVADLIDSNTRAWKTELIWSTFSEVDVPKILQIPLAQHSQNDLLIWRGEASSEYTVRSGYKLLLQGNDYNSNDYSLPEITKCYKKLWNCNLPSKVRITVWRATLNYLPTLVNLRIKGLTNNAICPRCKQGLETREHIFRDCVAAKEIWKKLNYVWSLELLHMDYMEWFTWVLLHSKEKGCCTFVCANWAIWSNRNQWVHGGHKRTGTETAQFVMQYLQELQDMERKYDAKYSTLDSWKAPESGFLKINFDAAFDKGKNISCSGVIVKNFKGDVLASKSVIHDNISSGFAAEALACLQAVIVGKELGIKYVIFEGDSLTHVKRAANKAAHNLASEGLKMGVNAYSVHESVTQVLTDSKIDRGWR
ncbi:hypothetical protein CXB51_005735 [Gossypium anomalum]|uniref:Reverse transcriptase n=1 Tax=Gossypium anomalum TaxID=47600 RepID=A0A8J5ZFZ0_9ROSI|nr:hypothetical protein CXB51_005735 [Gossypium anomalum]